MAWCSTCLQAARRTGLLTTLCRELCAVRCPPCRQLLLYPRGNNRPDSLSLYLAVAEEEQQAFGLQRTAVFKLTLLSKEEGGDVVKDTQHTFTVRETDWGEAAGGGLVVGWLVAGLALPFVPEPMCMC